MKALIENQREFDSIGGIIGKALKLIAIRPRLPKKKERELATLVRKLAKERCRYVLEKYGVSDMSEVKVEVELCERCGLNVEKQEGQTDFQCCYAGGSHSVPGDALLDRESDNYINS